MLAPSSHTRWRCATWPQIVDMRELIGFNAPLSVSARRWVQLAAYNVAFLTMFQVCTAACLTIMLYLRSICDYLPDTG